MRPFLRTGEGQRDWGEGAAGGGVGTLGFVCVPCRGGGVQPRAGPRPEGGQRPNGGGFGGMAGELCATFPIKDGGNYFVAVQKAP